MTDIWLGQGRPAASRPIFGPHFSLSSKVPPAVGRLLVVNFFLLFFCPQAGQTRPRAKKHGDSSRRPALANAANKQVPTNRSPRTHLEPCVGMLGHLGNDPVVAHILSGPLLNVCRICDLHPRAHIKRLVFAVHGIVGGPRRVWDAINMSGNALAQRAGTSAVWTGDFGRNDGSPRRGRGQKVPSGGGMRMRAVDHPRLRPNGDP